jgi:hypothetical protein
MYENMFAEGAGMPAMSVVIMLVLVAAIVVAIFLLILWLTGVFQMGKKKSEDFQNLPDYGIGQRGDVVVSIPVSEELSARQKVAQWGANAPQKSALTGTRDIPVFFQDYDVEMKRKDGAVGNAREGFQGKGDNELEKALAGQ